MAKKGMRRPDSDQPNAQTRNMQKKSDKGKQPPARQKSTPSGKAKVKKDK